MSQKTPNYSKTSPKEFVETILPNDDVFNDYYNANQSKPVLIEHFKDKYKLTEKRAKLVLAEWERTHPKPPKQPPKQASTTQKKTTDEELSLKQILKLKYFDDENRVFNYVKLIKMIKGRKKKFFLKIWLDNQRKPIYQILDFIPLNDTFISKGCFENHVRGKEQPKRTTRDFKKIYEKLREDMAKYIYFSEDIYYDIIVLVAVASYFLEVFHTFPYVDIHAPEHGFGKTIVMEVIIYSSYHGFWHIAPTAANLYRPMKENVILSMGLDELDNKLNSKFFDSDMVGILDAGNRKGGVVPRTNPDGDTEAFPAFCPKIWTRIDDIKPTLKSRAVDILMTQNLGKKTLEPNPTINNFTFHRDILYILRWSIMDLVRKSYEEILIEKPLSDRSEEVFYPILTIAKLIDDKLYERILKYAIVQGKEKEAVKINEFRKLMVITLLRDREMRETVKGTKIAYAYNCTLDAEGYLQKDFKKKSKPIRSQDTYLILRALGFKETMTSPDGSKYFNIPEIHLDELVRVYKLEELLEKVNEENNQKSEATEAPEAVSYGRTSRGNITSTSQLQLGSEGLGLGLGSHRKLGSSGSSFSPDLDKIEGMIFKLIESDYFDKISLDEIMEEGEKRGFDKEDLGYVVARLTQEGRLIDTPDERFTKP